MIRFGMHASLWTAEWTREAAEVALAEAARFGLDLVEIPLLDPKSIDVEHTLALMRTHGVAASGSLCLPIDSMAQTEPGKAEAFLMSALECAAALGCQFLGGVTYSALGFRSGRPPTEGEYANIVKALKPVARAAQGHGITLGVEPCNRYETHLCNTAGHGVMLLDRIGEPNVTIHLDTYHMNIEEKGHAHGFAVAKGKTSYVHMSESDRGVPGTGTIDWNEVYRGLKAIGFSGDLVLESFVTLPPSIAAALSVWRPVAKDRFEVLEKGVPYLKGLAREHGLIA